MSTKHQFPDLSGASILVLAVAIGLSANVLPTSWLNLPANNILAGGEIQAAENNSVCRYDIAGPGKLDKELSFVGRNSLIAVVRPANPDPEVIRKKTVTLTAYTSRVEETDDTPFITARGSLVRDGIVAANFLPFGTKIRIPEIYGNRVFQVEDRMNAYYTNQNVDIWFAEHKLALKFGVKRTYIEVLADK